MRQIRVCNDFELNEFESKSEFEEYIDVHEGIRINPNCEYKKVFYGLRVNLYNSMVIGFIGGGHGIEPSIVESINTILINIDDNIYNVVMNERYVKWEMNFNSIVYEVIKTLNESFLIVCDLGVASVSKDGKKLWEHTCDIITDFTLGNNLVKLVTDGGEYSLSLDSGSVIY